MGQFFWTMEMLQFCESVECWGCLVVDKRFRSHSVELAEMKAIKAACSDKIGPGNPNELISVGERSISLKGAAE